MENSSLYYYINYNLCQKSVWVGIPNEVYLVGGVSGDRKCCYFIERIDLT